MAECGSARVSANEDLREIFKREWGGWGKKLLSRRGKKGYKRFLEEISFGIHPVSLLAFCFVFYPPRPFDQGISGNNTKRGSLRAPEGTLSGREAPKKV